MTGKELGKISKITYGLNDREWLGLDITFSGKGWGVGAWIAHDNHERIRQILKEASVRDITDLVGTPVEITFEGNELKAWRVLTEVI